MALSKELTPVTYAIGFVNLFWGYLKRRKGIVYTEQDSNEFLDRVRVLDQDKILDVVHKEAQRYGLKLVCETREVEIYKAESTMLAFIASLPGNPPVAYTCVDVESNTGSLIGIDDSLTQPNTYNIFTLAEKE